MPHSFAHFLDSVFVSYTQISPIKKDLCCKISSCKAVPRPRWFLRKAQSGRNSHGFTEVFLGNRKEGNAFHDASIAPVSAVW